MTGQQTSQSKQHDPTVFSAASEIMRQGPYPLELKDTSDFGA